MTRFPAASSLPLNDTRPAPAILSHPRESFDLLVRRQITRLEQPGLQCIDLVFDELQRMASQCETTELTRFPELRDRVLDVVNQLLRKCVAPTQNMISNLIKMAQEAKKEQNALQIRFINIMSLSGI